MKRARKGPWPTKDGKPATREEIRAYVATTEAWFTQAPFATSPHFCRGCTAPLEHEPCAICWTHRYKDQVEKMKKTLEETAP